MAWLPVESTIRQRQAGYYAAFSESEAAGSCERFVEFMLEAIRDSIVPFAKPENSHEVSLANALSFFEQNPDGNVSDLAFCLGCSKRTAERIVAELKSTGRLARDGSTRAGKWRVIG